MDYIYSQQVVLRFMLSKIDNIENLSFEDALERLKLIMKNLQSNEIKLQDAVDQYEMSIALKEHCEKLLSNAKVKIIKIGENINSQESE